MCPYFPYGCPHVCNDYHWYGPQRCTQCIIWSGLVDLLASLFLLGIFALIAVQLR